MVWVQKFKKALACEEEESKSMVFKGDNVGDLCDKLMLNSIFFPREREYFQSVVIFKY